MAVCPHSGSSPWLDVTGGESLLAPGSALPPAFQPDVRAVTLGGGALPGDSGGTAPDSHRLPLLPPFGNGKSTTAGEARQLARDLRWRTVRKRTWRTPGVRRGARAPGRTGNAGEGRPWAPEEPGEAAYAGGKRRGAPGERAGARRCPPGAREGVTEACRGRAGPGRPGQAAMM
ncbi:hypothetical protein GCM10023079_42870 [Streptomyces chitinivorans]